MQPQKPFSEATPEDTAEYCASLLKTLQIMADEKKLVTLARLIEIAAVEARSQCGKGLKATSPRRRD